MTRRGVPGLYIDADMTQGVQAMGYLSKFLQGVSTEAHVREVVDATHRVFSQEFDQYIGHLAQSNPENYFHVYEYSASGDGFDHVRTGDPTHKLWFHTMNRIAGSDANASWRWLPAKNYNPTYEQRLESRVGNDAIRELDDEQLENLFGNTANRRYKFIWKAPMLEYGVRANIKAKRKALFMPMPGGEVLFRKFATTNYQWPGRTRGMFTAAWTSFWADVPQRWDQVLGEQIAKDAEMRIAQGLNTIGKKPRKRVRKFGGFTAAVSSQAAFEAGQQQAVSALRFHQKSIRGIESKRGIRSF